MKVDIGLIINLFYQKDQPFLANLKRLSIISIITVSFLIGFGRLYEFCEKAFILYAKYRVLNTSQMHRALNDAERYYEIKEKIPSYENILAVTNDPSIWFLAYYFYPGKVYKYKSTYFGPAVNTLEDVPQEWVSEHDIKWIFDGDGEVRRIRK